MLIDIGIEEQITTTMPSELSGESATARCQPARLLQLVSRMRQNIAIAKQITTTLPSYTVPYAVRIQEAK